MPAPPLHPFQPSPASKWQGRWHLRSTEILACVFILFFLPKERKLKDSLPEPVNVVLGEVRIFVLTKMTLNSFNRKHKGKGEF